MMGRALLPDVIFNVWDYDSDIHAAIAAAEAAGPDRMVYMPAGVYETDRTVVTDTARLVGEGPGASIIRWPSGQDGPVLQIDGVGSNGHYYRIHRDFTVQGDGTGGIEKKGILIQRQDGWGNWITGLSNVQVLDTGGVGLEAIRSYYLDIDHVVVERPVDADVNDVPYIRFMGCNGSVRQTITTDKSAHPGFLQPVNGVWRIEGDPNFTASGISLTECRHSNGRFVDGSTIVYVEAEAGQFITNFGFSDVSGPGGFPSDAFYFRLVDSPAQGWGGTVLSGLLPGNMGDKWTGGVSVETHRNVASGVRGWDGSCVVLRPGVQYNRVEIRGAVSGSSTSGVPAVIDNSGDGSNSWVDYFQGLDSGLP